MPDPVILTSIMNSFLSMGSGKKQIHLTENTGKYC